MAITDNCGHHCGIVTTGKTTHERHCDCNECHGRTDNSTGETSKEAAQMAIDAYYNRTGNTGLFSDYLSLLALVCDNSLHRILGDTDMSIDTGSHMGLNATSDLWQRIQDIQARMTDPLFTFDRNGLRLAIAAIDDECLELYDEWQHHKRMLDNGRDAIRHELLDIAAVALITYMQAEL